MRIWIHSTGKMDNGPVIHVAPETRFILERRFKQNISKITLPLFSFSASGQIGKALVYASWKGIQYVRKYVVPSNPNTPAQQVIRDYFTDAVDAGQAETEAVKTAWNDYARNSSITITGFNLYVGKYIQFLKANSGTPSTVTNSPPNMS